MRSEGADPDTITYNVLIDSLGPAGRAAEADALVQEMLEQGLQPSMSTYRWGANSGKGTNKVGSRPLEKRQCCRGILRRFSKRTVRLKVAAEGPTPVKHV